MTIPKGNASGENLSVLFKAIDELGHWQWGLLGSDQVQDLGSAVSFGAAGGLGRFQVVYLDRPYSEEVQNYLMVVLDLGMATS